MKSIFILAIGISIFSIPSFAQSDILTSKYIFNPMFFNPANTGMNDETELIYLMKSGLRFNSQEIPNKEILSVGIPIKGQRWSIGVNAMHQDLFLLNYLMVKPSAAYRTGFNNGNSTLSIGLSTSFTRLRVDEIALNPIIPQQNKYYPNIEAGIFYKSRFGYIGFAGRDLISKIIKVKNVSGNDVPILSQKKQLLLNGGINYFRFMNNTLAIRPSFSLTRVRSFLFMSSEIVHSEFNLEVELYGKFNFGISYRDMDALNSIVFSNKYIDAWLGYKDHEKKIMLITNWDTDEITFLNQLTVELLFGYILLKKESPVVIESHFF